MDSFSLVQAQSFTLSGSGISATSTSITLQSFQTPDGTNITQTNFGTTGYGTLEPGTSREEQITFTGVTQNANGTATLTGVTRGISFVSPYAEDADLKQPHSGGTVFVLSNTSKMYNEFLRLNDDGTVAETIIFTNPNFPKMDSSTAVPVDDEQLATKVYVDSVAAGSNVNINRLVVSGTAGETVQAGDFIYFDETDDEWKKADASAASTSENVLLGIAQGAGTDGNDISNGVLLQGQDENQSGLTIGSLYYLSDTAAAITDSAGTKEVQVGYALTATKLIFTPRFKRFVTKDQQDALAGTSGTPSSGNKYVTADDVAEDTDSKIVRRKSDGNVTVETTPTADTDAASKDYVDTRAPLTTIKANDTIIYTEANTERSTTATSYVKVKEIAINKAGTYNTTFQLKCSTTTGNSFGRIYKNEIAFGTERTTNKDTFQTYTEELTFAKDDLIQLYIYHDTGATSALVQNFQFLGTLQIENTVNLD